MWISYDVFFLFGYYLGNLLLDLNFVYNKCFNVLFSFYFKRILNYLLVLVIF